jgi:hypothetical protein
MRIIVSTLHLSKSDESLCNNIRGNSTCVIGDKIGLISLSYSED